MRRLRMVVRLCVGVALLLACWLTTFAAIAGLLVGAFNLWAFLATPVVLFLLFVGLVLLMDVTDEVEPDPGGGPISSVLVGSFFVVFGAMVVGLVTIDLGGPQIYHERFGVRTGAVVSSILELRADGYAKDLYYVRDERGESLGELAVNPWHETAEGDRIDVLVDPHGWIPPVPVDTMGDTTVAAVILVCCFAAVALAGLTVVGTALAVLVRSGPVPPPGRPPR